MLEINTEDYQKPKRYKIIDIINKVTNETTTESKHLSNVGCVVMPKSKPVVGEQMIFYYVIGKDGKGKRGVFKTPTIDDVLEIDSNLFLSTQDNVYELKRELWR